MLNILIIIKDKISSSNKKIKIVNYPGCYSLKKNQNDKIQKINENSSFIYEPLFKTNSDFNFKDRTRFKKENSVIKFKKDNLIEKPKKKLEINGYIINNFKRSKQKSKMLDISKKKTFLLLNK